MTIKQNIDELMEHLQSLSDLVELRGVEEYNQMFPEDNADMKTYYPMIIGKSRYRAWMAIEKLKDIKEQLGKENIC